MNMQLRHHRAQLIANREYHHNCGRSSIRTNIGLRMTKLFVIFLLVAMFITPSLRAEEPVDCTVLHDQISNDLQQPATCWTDKECQLLSWGCPWQKRPCDVSIYSTSEEDRNKELSKKIVTYSNNCIAKDEKMRAKCDKFYKIAIAKECSAELELLCLNGVCSTPFDVIMQDIGMDSVDIYGSREAIGLDR